MYGTQIICSTILLIYVANGPSVNWVSMGSSVVLKRPGAKATDHPAMKGKLKKSG